MKIYKKFLKGIYKRSFLTLFDRLQLYVIELLKTASSTPESYHIWCLKFKGLYILAKVWWPHCRGLSVYLTKEQHKKAKQLTSQRGFLTTLHLLQLCCKKLLTLVKVKATHMNKTEQKLSWYEWYYTVLLVISTNNIDKCIYILYSMVHQIIKSNYSLSFQNELI